jgi:serine/threonine-protein kinase
MPLILDGKFLPLKFLGEGGFGRTFLAQDLSFPQRPLRVIKQLSPRNPTGKAFRSAELTAIRNLFFQEAELLDQLNYPHIPRVLAFSVIKAPPYGGNIPITPSPQDSFFYLVQSYITGKDLSQVITPEGTWTELDVQTLLRQLLGTLQYIHDHNVIHRDVKPSNIIRDDQGKYWLIDFGAVKQVVAGVPTEQSLVLGTPGFAPPEQIAGRPIDASSDLYALAATCVCLLTGQSVETLRRQGVWTWEHPRIRAEFAAVLNKMLQSDPGDRFSSATAVLNALESGIREPNTLSPVTPAPTSPALPPRRWRRGHIAALIGAVGTAIVGWSGIHLGWKTPPLPGSTIPSITPQKTFRTLAEVPLPSGDFGDGGSTTWAPIRKVFEERIEQTHPTFQLSYIEPPADTGCCARPVVDFFERLASRAFQKNQQQI